MFDYWNVTDRFKETGIAHAELALDGGHTLILPERGGHALGPFDKAGRSCFWLSNAFADAAAFAALLERGDWNIGGMRLWIAPEIRLGVRDRARYWDTLTVQPDMEPTACGWSVEAGKAACRYAMRLEVYNPAAPAVELQVERKIAPVRNPLAGRFPDLDYFGFEHEVTLRKTNASPIALENWNLIQVRGGGKAFVPVTGEFLYQDYYEPLERSHYRTLPGVAVLNLDGKKRFKIGVAAASHFGRIGHWRMTGDNVAELLIYNYFNDPSALYAEQPADDPEASGLSMHFYNDGGMFGGFGELEANGRTIGCDGVDARTDAFTVWGFRGGAEMVRMAAQSLLGVGELENA